MRYDVKTPAEYMEALEEDWRRETLTDETPTDETRIQEFITKATSLRRDGQEIGC